MARRQSLRVRSAARCLAAVGMASLAAHRLAGSSYVVKSSWEGEPGAVKDYAAVVKGVEPNVALPSLGFALGDGVALSVEDGHLVASYKSKLGDSTNLGVNVKDDEAWNAMLDNPAGALKLRGQGRRLDGWEASTSGSAAGVGDVSLNFNSDKEYKLSVVNADLGEIAGASFSGKATATNEGVTGRLEGRRDLPGDVGVKWSIENDLGDYDLRHAKEAAELTKTVAGGDAAMKLSYENEGLGYEGTYSRPVRNGHAALKLSMKDSAMGYNISYAEKVRDLADVLVGLDTDGAYGTVSASRAVTDGLNANYEARVRASFDGEIKPRLAHALKLSNKLGYAQLLHGTDEAPRLRMGYEFDVHA